MLDFLRARAQGWLAWVLVSVLCLMFALWGIEHYLDGGRSNDLAAKVDGVPITKAQHLSVYERLRRQYQAQVGGPPLEEESDRALRDRALDVLLQMHILSQSSKKMGFFVSEPMLQRQLSAIPAFTENGRFSKERFYEALAHMQYREDEFMKELQSVLLIDQMGEGLSFSSFALPHEAEQMQHLVQQQRDIRYVSVPLQKVVPTIPEEQLLKYYQSHLEAFARPEEVKIAYLKLSLPDLIKNEHLTDADLRAYYDQNRQAFMEPQRWRLAHLVLRLPSSQDQARQQEVAKLSERIQKDLDAGQRFEDLAARYSEDKLSASEGGALPWMDPQTLDPQVRDEVSKLQKGQVSPVIKTRYGWVRVKLLDREESKLIPFEKVRERIEQQLKHDRAEQKLHELANRATELSYAQPRALDSLASALKLPLSETDYFSRQGKGSDLMAHPKILKAAFSPEVLQQGNNSELIQLTPDTLIMLRVVDQHKAQTIPFEEVRDKIQSQLQSLAREDLTQKRAQSLLQELQSSSIGLGPLAQREGLTLVKRQALRRYASDVPGLIVEETFKTARPAPGHPSLRLLQMPSGDRVILSVDSVSEDSDRRNLQTKVFSDQMAAMYGQMDYLLYVSGQMKRAKIQRWSEPPRHS